MTDTPVRLLILGTGGMSKLQMRSWPTMPEVEIVGAVDPSPERLATFLATYDIPRGFASLEDALAWGDFEAITNMTPDSMHHATTMLAIAAGKHVLCEKPLSTDFLKAHEMTEAANAAGLINMCNLTYRNVAHLQKTREMVLDGAIGKVRHVEASYLQSWLVSNAWGDWKTDPTWLWRLSRSHGSNGVLGDIGIHILDFATYGSGSEIADISCRLKTFKKAEGDRIGDYPLDVNDSFAMVAEYENGALGVIHASRFATGHLNDLSLTVYGTEGALEVKHAPEGSTLRACLGEDVNPAIWREIEVEPGETNYQRFARSVRTGINEEPTFAHAANLQKWLDLGMATEGKSPLAG